MVCRGHARPWVRCGPITRGWPALCPRSAAPGVRSGRSGPSSWTRNAGRNVLGSLGSASPRQSAKTICQAWRARGMGSAGIGGGCANLFVESSGFGRGCDPVADCLAGMPDALASRITGRLGGDIAEERGKIDATSLRLSVEFLAHIVVQADRERAARRVTPWDRTVARPGRSLRRACGGGCAVPSSRRSRQDRHPVRQGHIRRRRTDESKIGPYSEG